MADTNYKYTAWAADSNADKDAPSEDKVSQGWLDNEYPPNEYFNWWQNRADSRLDVLESPVEHTVKSDLHRAGRATYAAGSFYKVPKYKVGAKQLEVYLDGILCNNGETYGEGYTQDGNAVVSGKYAEYIKWNDAIDATYDIVCRAPVFAENTDNFYGVTQKIVEDVLADSNYIFTTSGNNG